MRDNEASQVTTAALPVWLSLAMISRFFSCLKVIPPIWISMQFEAGVTGVFGVVAMGTLHAVKWWFSFG